jgi:integrase
MGRRRQSNHDDPPRFHKKGKTWYHVALVEGKRKWTKLSSDRAEALRAWAHVEGVRADDSTKLFSVIVQRYQREVYPLKAPRTRQDNDKEIVHLLRVFGHMPIDAILPRDIRQYMDIRGETAKTRANREKALFSHIFNKAREWGYTASQNPCQGVKGFKEAGRDRYVTDEEFSKVWDVAHPTVRDAMDIALLTGQRPADVLKIQYRDIRDGALWVRQNKTKAVVGIEIVGELKAVIARISDRPRRAISPFLIHEENGQPLTLTVLRNRFEKAKKLACVEFQFRDIRAKAATDTGDLAHSQKLLAHRKRDMTEHYVRSRIGERVKPLR